MDHQTRKLIAAALTEDIGPGDITSRLSIPETATARARLLAKEEGVVCGLDVCAECFRQVDEQIVFEPLLAEGDCFEPGRELAVIAGPARPVLTAERVALNFLQRLCGVASLTRRFVDLVATTKARIVDTRKTTPGLRMLQKRAVRAGGGYNHRFALHDGILLKDNHIAVAGGVRQAVEAAVAGRPHPLRVEVEITRIDQLEDAISAGADVVLLDNMSLEQLREAVALAAGRVVTEASGGVTLDTVQAIAETGIDYISAGALTHSAPAIDISLDVVVE
jgi:nicotinate-nucleotide pyrophosphorylase (carboxylating)